MKYDLIIDSRPSEVVIALLRDGQLIELHKQKHDNNFSVGIFPVRSSFAIGQPPKP